jgi:hypothetical protein
VPTLDLVYELTDTREPEGSRKHCWRNVRHECHRVERRTYRINTHIIVAWIIETKKLNAIIPIVNALEAIKIKHDEGHRLVRKTGSRQQPFARVEEAATVRNTGQWINQRGAPIACGNPIFGEAPE